MLGIIPTPLFTAGKNFATWDPIVSTTVFHWFTPTDGNLNGHWPPPEGRVNWTGEKDWWMGQVKQIMMANIDVLYVHLINNFEQQRINLFEALYELRTQGYDVPKVAPFLDPFGIWTAAGITLDVGTTQGKDEFVKPYIRFYQQYFGANPDPQASSYLAQVDGNVMITMWWVYSILANLEMLTREDVQKRLCDALGAAHPLFLGNIYVVSTALIDPDITFSDERAVMFSGYAYCIQSVHKGTHTYHMQAGYWDQNIRKPGYIMPRHGGKPYRGAWDYVLYQCSPVHRIYVESWNEYDESSGIYAADPKGPENRREDLQTDVWSDANDPMEYIRTTGEGAAVFNKGKAYDARLLHNDLPPTMSVGESRTWTVVVQNRGNTPWKVGGEFTFQQKHTSALGFAKNSYNMSDAAVEVDATGGVFRGAPLCYSIEIQAPTQRGRYSSVWTMMRDGYEEFGEELSITIEVL